MSTEQSPENNDSGQPLGLGCNEGLGLVPERAAFERWADDQGFSLTRVNLGDDYQDLRTQGPWEAWQAAQAHSNGRSYTQADLMEAVKTECHACSIAVWMTLQDALAEGADDKGLDGWMREAEQRVKSRLAHHRTEAHSVGLTRCPAGKCEDPARDCYGSGCLGPNVRVKPDTTE